MARYDIRQYNATLTPEQRTERARQGALATNEKRRQRKSMREGFKEALKAGVTDASMEEALKAIGLEPTMQNAILFAAIGKAMTGDIEAARFVRDTIGEKPTEALQIAAVQDVQGMDVSGLTDAELQAIIADTD